MEHIYQAYTKKVNGTEHYFVKKYLCFPEYHQVADVLEGYGMHEDFSKACQIAGIADPQLINKIFQEMTNTAPLARVIDIGGAVTEIRANAG